MPTIESEFDGNVHSLGLLFSTLNYLVLEAVGTELCLSKITPSWFDRLTKFGSSDAAIDRLPYLESFLPEATAFWEAAETGSIQSDFWTQTDVFGSDIHLLADAVFTHGRNFLFVRSVEEIYKERQEWQTYAHETVIQLREMERLRRDIEDGANALAIANAKLSELSIQDSLTGVYNRRHFEQCFDLESRRTFRSGEPISILFLDIDHFKLLNDTFGHSAGDECLRSIGQLLRGSLHRPGDLVARIGGEEFAIVLPGIAAEAALQLANGICQKVRELRVLINPSLRITVSIGVHTRPPRGEETLTTMLRIVDNALYKAKRRGRDQVAIWNDAK